MPSAALRGRSLTLVLVVSLVFVQFALGMSGARGQSVDDARRQVEQSRDELAAARDERAVVQERLDAAAVELAQLQERVALLEAERDDLTGQLDDLEAQLEASAERVAARVREVYKRGVSDPIALFLSSEDTTEALGRATTVQQLVEGDLADAEVTTVTRTQVQAVADQLSAKQDELDTALAHQERVTAQLEADLERAAELEEQLEGEVRDAEARERRAREEAARRIAAAEAAAAAAAASAPAEADSGASFSAQSVSGSGGMACPVDNPRSFTDTWGQARSGGRGHQGTDILNGYGNGIRAIVSGSWEVRPYGGSAGHWGILHGSNGNQYWYMHLQGHVVGGGASVSAGQLVATNGDTGNARGTPHLHFELHPGGGAAVNPYGLLRQVCG